MSAASRSATLRMRSAGLLRQIQALPKNAFTTIRINRPGRCRTPKVAEMPEVTITNYPDTMRQLG